MTKEPSATILVIDGEAFVRSGISSYLHDLGYATLEAENGRAGLEVFRRQKPDVVLLDLRLPGMDGLQVMEAIRHEAPDTPTIVISGSGVVADAVEALHRGAWDYIVKPIEDLAVLDDAVDRVLHRVDAIHEDRRRRDLLEERIQARTEELERQHRLNERLLDSLPHPAALIRTDRVIVAANAVARRAGATVGGLCWRNFGQFSHACGQGRPSTDREKCVSPDGGPCAFCLADQAMDTQQPRSATDLRAFGRVWDTQWVPLDEDTYLHFAVDVTERKRVEANLKRANAELRVINAEMERFTQTVSHDLKSPLITILGFINRIREDAGKGSFEAFYRSAGRIEQAAHRMTRLIDDLLELSRIGRITEDPEPAAIGDLLSRWASEHEHTLAEKGAVLEIAPTLPTLRIAPVRLAQVLDNLLGNALRYGTGARSPRIACGAVHTDREICLYVRDNGQGITEEDGEKVFELFHRLQGNSEGTGIGLAIVRRITEVYGGRAWVESRSGSGATFWVAFPEDTIVTPAQDRAALQCV